MCKNNKNGFATCRDECTGGGQKCSTKYCNETRYKDVPRYKNVRKSRQKPRYRSEPRLATWYAWKTWEWVENRRLAKQGDHTETAWPGDAEIALSADGRIREKAERSAVYDVHIAYGGSADLVHHPATEEEFRRFTTGSLQVLWEQGGSVVLFSAPPAQELPPL